jgi:FkbM family methyltransferase
MKIELLLLQLLMSAWAQRSCRSAQIAFYAQNQREFFGERGTHALKERLLSCPHDVVSDADALVIDVGANVGQSYAFLRRYSPRARAVLFEPNPASAEALRANTAGDENVLIFEGAVGEHNGSAVTFNFQHANGAANEHGSLSTVNVYEAGEYKTRVPMFSLDAMLERMMLPDKRSVHFLKIDTEGFDQLVLYGAARLLRRTRLVLWECHELQRAARGGPGTTIYESVDYMQQHGFLTFVVGSSRLLRLDAGLYHPHYDTAMQWQNCLSVHRSERTTLACLDAHLLPVCDAKE